MDGFTLIDGVVAIVIILSSILAFSRGVVREALAILGWVIAALVAFAFAPTVEPLVGEIPVVGSLLADSCELAMVAGFAAVFAVALVIVSLITPYFSTLIQKSKVSGVDQGLGFLFGALRGVILVAVAFFAYDTIMSNQAVAVVDDSRSAKIFSNVTKQVEERDPEKALGWVTSQFEELVGACEG
ncbi:MAG: CvpA family protein [Paracoccaceae bacterium]|nr:CvpA family protein [Paracoccaceae bacterium]MDG2257932.1 CvpA family protein [Paracoccaceae bacterium]